jgi:hypothetical protein
MKLQLPVPPPWWLTIGNEAAGEPDCCPQDGAPPQEVIDLFCPDHEVLLPFSRHGRSVGRLVVINLLRAIVCGAFLLAAQLNDELPLILFYCAGAAAVLLLMLRAFRLTARATGVAAACVVVAVLAGGGMGSDAQRWMVTGAIVLTVILWMAYTGRVCMVQPHEQGHRPGVTLSEATVAAALTGPPVLTAALLITVNPYLPAALADIDRFRPLLLVALAGSVATIVLTAALIAALTAARSIDPNVTDLLRWGSRPQPVRWGRERAVVTRRHRHGLVENLRATVELFRKRLKIAAKRLAASLATMSKVAVWILMTNLVNFANWLWRLLVRTWRRIVAATVEAVRLLGRSAHLGVLGGAMAGRVIVAVAGLLVLLAILGAVGGEANRAYLAEGGLAPLFTVGLVATALVMTLYVLAGLLSRTPPRRLVASAGRTAAVVLPQGLLLVAVGGWAVGLPGTLGHGPIRVGLVTVVASIILLVAVLIPSRSGKLSEVGQGTAPGADIALPEALR